MRHGFLLTAAAFALTFTSAPTLAAFEDSATIPPVSQRYISSDAGGETPDFQKHVTPLLGKLGCNGRACHGSFQGRGGFRLSLFGYDFKTDHDELFGRIDPEVPADSLILQKATMQVQHDGGQRIKPGSWEYHLLLRWVQAGSQPRTENPPSLLRLEVTPSEILFTSQDQQQKLTAIAVWSDGSREDVTTLCRFQTNDDQVADITQEGLVTAASPGDTHVVAFYDSAVVPVPVIRPVSPQYGDKYPSVPAPTKVDQLVVQKLRKVGIIQSDLCTDAEFLRRVSLDVTGTLPTPSEVRTFLLDQAPDKRSRKIDELLERPGYVAWWTTKLCDFTGNSDDKLNNVTPVQGEASKHWYAWLEKRVRTNEPYDKIMEGIVMAVSRDPGESYEDYCTNVSKLYHKDGPGAAGYADRQGLAHFWARQNFQTSEDRVIAFAYTFLGTRIQCAQCHKHPFDQWTQDDFKQFEGFFKSTAGRQAARPDAKADYDRMLAQFQKAKEVKGNDLRRILADEVRGGATIPLAEVYAVKAQPTPQRRGPARNNPRAAIAPPTAKILAGPVVDLTQYEDPRQPLMDWLRSPENPLFAKAFVNRVWAAYFNAGIVSPADDLNLANPPVNAELFNYLAKGFIENGFDMKWLHREILNSRTYQLSWIPNSTNRQDERNFSHAVPRRLPAEIAVDVLLQATLNNTRNAEFVTSLDKRAVAIPGAGLRRSSRSPADYALTVFGRSIRESNCDCDRSEEPSLLQTIFLRNDSQALALLDANDGWLAEIAKQHNLTFTRRSSPDGADVARESQRLAQREQLKERFIARVKRLKAQIAEAEKDNAERQVTSLRNQLKTLREQAKTQGIIEPEDENAAAAENSPAGVNLPPEFNAEEIITEAWLRTLSRFPTADEIQTAQTHIKEAQDPVEGIRSVLWALLNTREFVVNH
ncbi:MAG: DUF1549 domain-containing protein [Planctomycetaceae bacterium]